MEHAENTLDNDNECVSTMEAIALDKYETLKHFLLHYLREHLLFLLKIS